MAQLNLRDRVVETTIAYVGAAAGSNLAYVKGDVQRGRAGVLQETEVSGGRLLSLDWRPREGVKLNDCELSVKLVSPAGPLEPEAMQRFLVDADGLVLVLEGDAEVAENERAIAIVRDALERAPEKSMPVVVQVNQRDGATGEQSVDGLGVENWPRVNACAAKGDGVMETLQLAVDGVVESIQRPPAAEPAPPRAPASRADGNPLLGALRQLLQASVTEEVAALELRLVGHLERQTRARNATVETLGERLTAFDASLEKIESVIGELAERTSARSETGLTDQDVARIAARVVADAQARSDELRECIASLTSAVGRVEAHRDAFLGEVKESRKAMREDVSRVVAAGANSMQRTVDGISTEVTKSVAAGASAVQRIADGILAEVTKSIAHGAGLAEQVEAGMGDVRDARTRIDSLAKESLTVTKKLGELGLQVKQVGATVGLRLTEVSDSVHATLEKSDQRIEAAQTELAVLTGELKKRNKGWFG